MTSLRVENLGAALSVSAYHGLGVRGDQIPTTGEHGGSFLQDSANRPADNAVEFRFEILTGPTGGASFTSLGEDGAFVLSVPGDGSYSWTFRVWANSVDQGIATATVTIGAAGVTLIVSNAGSDSGAGVVAVSQSHALSVSDAGADAGADSVAALVAGTLSVINAGGESGAGTPAVSQSHILLVLSAGSDSGADNVPASTDPVATVTDAGADSGADPVAISLEHLLAVADAGAAAGADPVQAMQDGLLAVASAGGEAGATSIVVIQSSPPVPGTFTDEHAQWLKDLWQERGLDPANPKTTTPGSVNAGDVQQQITGDGVNVSQVTRL